MSRRCVFCGGGSDSREHAFPLWLNDVLSELGEEDITHAIGERAKWQSSGFDVKVRQVCRQCNNTWMSELEKKTKPLLVPILVAERTYPLAHSEQIRLAKWAYKTAIMLALAAPEDERWVPADHYAFFLREREPPPGTFIWAGAMEHDDSGEAPLGWSTPEKLEYRSGDGVQHEPNGYRLSFTIVRAVFQVIHDPHGARLDRPRALRDVWTRIRPISKGDWPPGRALGFEEVSDLVSGRFIEGR